MPGPADSPVRLAAICAMGANRAIGRRNGLPWHIPEDLKRFKRLTMGHVLIMGRRTHQSIGRALPGRTNLVLTRDPAFAAAGCRVEHSLEEALRAAGALRGSADEEVFVIGGGEIYRQTLPLAGRLYLTIVDDSPADADTFFPDHTAFDRVVSEAPFRSVQGPCGRFLVLERS